MKKALILSGVYFDGEKVCGAGVYTAAGLARLGIPTVAAAKIDGAHSAEIREFFRKYGVDDERLIEDERELDFSLDDYGAVFLTGEFVLKSEQSFENAKRLCDKCEKLEIPVVFDPGENSGGAAKILEIAKKSEIFVPSIEDAAALCGLSEPEKTADYFLAVGVKKIVITMGKGGAFYKSRVETGSAPTFRADKVVDLTGAGDAFAAGLVSGALEKLPLGEAVVRANACGCFAIQGEGFFFPDMMKLREYMLSHRFVVDGCTEA